MILRSTLTNEPIINVNGRRFAFATFRSDPAYGIAVELDATGQPMASAALSATRSGSALRGQFRDERLPTYAYTAIDARWIETVWPQYEISAFRVAEDATASERQADLNRRAALDGILTTPEERYN